MRDSSRVLQTGLEGDSEEGQETRGVYVMIRERNMVKYYLSSVLRSNSGTKLSNEGRKPPCHQVILSR